MRGIKKRRIGLERARNWLNFAPFFNRFLEPDAKDLCADESFPASSKWRERHRYLTEAIGHVLEDYSLVKYVPLNIKDEESLVSILFMVDNCIQFGEDQDVKIKDFDPPEEDDEEKDDGYEDGKDWFSILVNKRAFSTATINSFLPFGKNLCIFKWAVHNCIF